MSLQQRLPVLALRHWYDGPGVEGMVSRRGLCLEVSELHNWNTERLWNGFEHFRLEVGRLRISALSLKYIP